jgi:hypothetical protein
MTTANDLAAATTIPNSVAASDQETASTAPWHLFARQKAAELTEGDGDTNDREQLEIEVITPSRQRLSGRGRFENNLSRKGIFELRPERTSEQSGTLTRHDLVGKTTLTFTLGALGPLEMDLIAWTMGQWHRGSDYVQFSLRELTRALGVSWKGQLGQSIKEGLRRIKATTISGKVWDANSRRHITSHFSIFDTVHIVEQRRSADGPATSPATVSIKLSDWIVSQLRAGQYSDFDWHGYRGKLTSAFSRRLYLLIESHEGEQQGVFLRLPINASLGDTLGTDDAVKNPSRFRSRVRMAGDEICNTLPHYLSVVVKQGKKRGEYWLEVRRSSTWHEERVKTRRRSLADSVA